MDESEFDKFAEEYDATLASHTQAFAKSTRHFIEYKVADVQREAAAREVVVEKILDFGSGIGASIAPFQDRFPDAELVCGDVSERSLRVARRHQGGKVRFQKLNGEVLPFASGSFDVVFSSCVFHHIPHEEHPRILTELLRVTKQNGFLIVFEHNPFNPLTVRTVNACPFDENAVLISRRQFEIRLRGSGFVNVEGCYRLFIPGPLAVFRWFELVLRWLPLGAQYYVVGTR